ncbi:MAG TPA: M43 family zinc metalloprotease, partial [Puia sp.]|nr:M43 family zinc metalloprotease [Puia sp.]
EYMTDVATMHPSRGTDGMADSASSSRDTLPGEVIVVPVVVHILYNNNQQNITDGQVLSQLKVLNDDYRRLNADSVNTPAPFKGVAADSKIIFRLAKVDPNGYYTTGIIHKYTSQGFFLSDDEMKFSSSGGDDAWDCHKYLNIWVCNLFGRTLGYAAMPGGPVERDGVVILYTAFGTTGSAAAPYNKGRTTTHEIGHWLGLRHLWGDAVCGDDGIADTPPQEGSTSGCPSFPQLSSCSVNSYGNMFMDYMDFTDDACMNMFTKDQAAEMRSLFALGNVRNSILASTVCDSTLALKDTAVSDSGNTVTGITISVFPNPFTDHFTIHSNDGKGLTGVKANLYNIAGRLLLQQTISSSDMTIHTSDLPAGIYILKLEGLNTPKVFKLIKGSSASQ